MVADDCNLRPGSEDESNGLTITMADGSDENPTPQNVAAPADFHRTSVSEAVELASTETFNAPSWISWIEMPFRVADSKTGKLLPEATGWALDSAGRGPLNVVGSYVGGAILRMAIEEAGDADNTVRGLLKPSSLLTATSSFVGVIAALLMPVVGAIIDHTHHRRTMGVLSGIVAVAMIGIQVSISAERNNWFFILVIDAIQSFGLLVHHTAVMAYLPDLSRDEQVISHYTSHFNIRQYTVQIVYMTTVILATRARGNNGSKTVEASVRSAKDAAGISFGLAAFCLGYAWFFLFRDRPALSKVPEGSNLLTTGFVQVHRTAKKIWKDYRALRWFMISLLFSPEAGAGVVLSIAVTYFTVVMEFAVQDIAKSTLILMIFTVPGSFIAKKMNTWLNPLNSYRLGMTLLGISMGMGGIILTGPERRSSVFGLCAAWGIFFGWAYPSQRVLFCTLIPKGQETEMMGLFTFMGQILGWLPPLIVTILNENDFNLRYSLLVVLFFFCFAIVLTIPMGSYETACEVVERDSERKLEAVVDAAIHHVDVAVVENGGKPVLGRESDNGETKEGSNISGELNTERR